MYGICTIKEKIWDKTNIVYIYIYIYIICDISLLKKKKKTKHLTISYDFPVYCVFKQTHTHIISYHIVHIYIYVDRTGKILYITFLLKTILHVFFVFNIICYIKSYCIWNYIKS